MNDNQLLRYSRHILLPQVDIQGQEKLAQSRVLIIGAGGLGSPAALYLAASGIGKLIICDHDNVDLTNLQRQIIHHTDSIGLPKVQSAHITLSRINPEIDIFAVQEHIDEARLSQLATDVDAVVDTSDNFATRYLVNKVCVTHKKPLISGAVIRFDGQVSVYDLRNDSSPCYHCLYPINEEHDDTPCAVMGVFSPLAGIIGCIQAAETIKVLLNIGTSLNGRLQLLDSLTMNWRSIKLHKDPACRVCSTSHPKTNSA